MIDGLPEDKILEIVNFLKSCAGDSNAKEFVASSIAGLVLNHYLDSFKDQPDKLLTLVEILDECFRPEDSYVKNRNGLYVKTSVARSIQNLFIGKVKVLGNTELSANILSFYKDRESENSQNFLNQLIQNSFFQNLTKEGKEKLKKLLGDCLQYFD